MQTGSDGFRNPASQGAVRLRIIHYEHECYIRIFCTRKLPNGFCVTTNSSINDCDLVANTAEECVSKLVEVIDQTVKSNPEPVSLAATDATSRQP